MPLYTQHYRLGIKLSGEAYSASLDRARMLTIDSQLDFISDIVGDGKVFGWDVEPQTFGMSVGDGIGIIDKFVVQTFGPIFVPLDEGESFLFAKIREGQFGGYSDFAGPVSFNYVDESSPDAPSSASASAVSFESISLSWTESISDDAFEYEIWRSIDNTGSGWNSVTEPLVTVDGTVFVDTNLDQQTTYYYRIYTLDPSGNRSSTYASTSALTLDDLRVPLAPRGMQVFTSSSRIQVVWQSSPSNFVSGYRVSAQPLDVNGNPSGDSLSANIVSSSFYTFNGLDNGTRYKISVQAKQVNGVLSPEVSLNSTPSENDGPPDADSLAVEEFWDGTNLSLNLEWDQNSDSASGPPFRWQITLVEDGERNSNPILVSGLRQKVLINNARYGDESRPISEKSNYLVRIQAVNQSNTKSFGTISQIKTSKWSNPLPVSNVALNLFRNENLKVTWLNPVDDFERVLISLTKFDPAADSTSIIISDLSVGKAESYTSPILIESGVVYSASVVTVDSGGNKSEIQQTDFSTESGIPLPLPPTAVRARSRLGYVSVQWDVSLSLGIQKYKVYRTPFAFLGDPISATEIATVDSDVYQIDDYSVDVGERYTYMVVSIDSFGNESSGPSQGDFSFASADVTVDNSSGIEEPKDFEGNFDSDSFNLTWSNSNDGFDGYQVFRSENGGIYHRVASIGRSETSWSDTNFNKINGSTYSYVLRKYRNEAEFEIREKSALGKGSVFLGKLDVDSSGNVVYSEDAFVDLSMLRGPIRREARKRLAKHRHFKFSEEDDRRISLDTNWKVSDWSTSRGTVWTTEENIFDTGLFSVFIDGNPTNILYDLDKVRGELTFEESIDEDSLVEVVFSDLAETQGILPPQKVGDVSASRFDRGKIPKEAIPKISHEGRKRDRLLPRQNFYTSGDGFVFYPDDRANNSSTNNVDNFDSEMFYSLAPGSSEGSILAATGRSLMLSNNAGVDWTNVLTTNSLTDFFKDVYKIDDNNWVAISRNNVFFSDEELQSWSSIGGQVSGIGSSKIVRKFLAASDGNFYVTTDSGVHRLDNNDATKRWARCSPPNDSTTDSYGIYEDDSLGAIVVSTARGLSYTTDGGDTWTQWSAFVRRESIYEFMKIGTSVYAISGNKLFRKKTDDSTFKVMHVFESRIRSMAHFKSKIYIASETGVHSSQYNFEDEDDKIIFNSVMPEVATHGQKLAANSLAVISSNLFIGTENRLWAASSHTRASIQYRKFGSNALMVFVDGEVRRLGWYFSLSNIVFDSPISPLSAVSVSNQFGDWYSQDRGWLTSGPASPVSVFINNAKVTEDQQSEATFSVPFSLSSTALLRQRVSSETVSDQATALSIIDKMEEQLDAARQAPTQDLSGNPDNSIFGEEVRKYAVLLEELKNVFFDASIFTDPNFRFSLNTNSSAASQYLVDSVTVDSAEGQLFFPRVRATQSSRENTLSSSDNFNSYSVVEIDVTGTSIQGEGKYTHDEIEDSFSKKLSFLESPIAQILRSNTIRSDIFMNNTYEDSREKTSSTSPPHNLNIYGGCENTWYRKFDSTVDYSLRVRKNPDNLSLLFPSSCIIVEARNEVWVSGLGGIIAVDIDSLTVSSVFRVGDSKNLHPANTVNSMYVFDDRVFATLPSSLLEFDISSLDSIKDDSENSPTGLTSVIVYNNQPVVAAHNGVFVRDVTKSWFRSLETEQPCDVWDAGGLAVARERHNKFYTSPTGESWTEKGDGGIRNTPVTSLVRHRTNLIATPNGLYDDSLTLFANTTQFSKANLPSEGGANGSPINDVFSDKDVAVVGVSDGRYYLYGGGTGITEYVEYDNSENLELIHKVLIVNGLPWLFGSDRLHIPSRGTTIKLATGERLQWLT
jgi:hypothetical protein